MTKLTADNIPEELLLKLNLLKIFTVNDFLGTDSDKLSTSINTSVKEIYLFKEKIYKTYSEQIHNGVELYRRFLNKGGVIQTQIKGLDELLQGGLRTGTIVELCGLSGSGKTQLCINILGNVALNIETHFIDTKGDFSATHFATLLEEKLSESEVLEVINSVKIQRTSDIFSLITILHTLKNVYIKCKNVNKKLIIIDSLTVPYLPFMGQATNEGLSLVNHIATLLKYLSTECNAAVLITNLGAKKFKTEEMLDGECDKFEEQEHNLKPFLGKYWLHVPNTRLIISKSNNGENTNWSIQVEKSDVLRNGEKCTVNILKNGLIL